MEAEPFARLEGFSICEGSAEGIVHVTASPYGDEAKVTGATILVLEYPASTFLRLMAKAGGVIAESGTNRIEAAKFLGKAGKPVFFGAGALSGRLSDGLRVRMNVTADGVAAFYLI